MFRHGKQFSTTGDVVSAKTATEDGFLKCHRIHSVSKLLSHTKYVNDNYRLKCRRNDFKSFVDAICEENRVYLTFGQMQVPYQPIRQLGGIRGHCVYLMLGELCACLLHNRADIIEIVYW